MQGRGPQDGSPGRTPHKAEGGSLKSWADADAERLWEGSPTPPHLLHRLLFQVLGLPDERELRLLAHLLEMVGPQGQHLCGEGVCGAHTCASGPRLQAPPLNL